MKIQASAENYLEAIYVLHLRNNEVRSIDIAHELGFSKPSVSVAMKQLRTAGYILTDSAGYITLTEEGHKQALRVYERHSVLSALLVALGVDKDVAAEDACRIEHVLSEESFEAIREKAISSKFI